MARKTTALKMLATLSLFAASPGYADEFHIRETFLSGPTSWCARDFGVPVIVEVTGLRLHGGGIASSEKKTVRVRRGDDTEFVEVGRRAFGEIRTRLGTRSREISTLPNPPQYYRAPEPMDSGLFSAKGELCRGIYEAEYGDVEWSVKDDNGETVKAGRGRPLNWWSVVRSPDSSFRRYPYGFKIGDVTFVIFEEPTFVRTTVAFPDLEADEK